MTGSPLLSVENLEVRFDTGAGPVTVVSDVSFALDRGRTSCLVGESGCGKSVTAMALIGLLAPNAQVSAKAIRFDGVDLAQAPDRLMRAIRGRRIGMIFQEPMTSLNPTMTVGEQIAESLRTHLGMAHREARTRAIELLGMVRIPRAAQRVDDYPFVFSGGMRQRVMIAMALACAPTLLIADEPTTALDVTVQAEILDLLRELQHETGTALLLITHDLGVVAEIADEVMVMYAGRIVERADVAGIFDLPEHPYTIGLLGSLPGRHGARRLTPIEGKVPTPDDPAPGCQFAPRCPFRIERCAASEPPLAGIAPGHAASCWRAPLEPLEPLEPLP
jgi:peptide/nickel transport system ATP-binding protein